MQSCAILCIYYYVKRIISKSILKQRIIRGIYGTLKKDSMSK